VLPQYEQDKPIPQPASQRNALPGRKSNSPSPLIKELFIYQNNPQFKLSDQDWDEITKVMIVTSVAAFASIAIGTGLHISKTLPTNFTGRNDLPPTIQVQLPDSKKVARKSEANLPVSVITKPQQLGILGDNTLHFAVPTKNEAAFAQHFIQLNGNNLNHRKIQTEGDVNLYELSRRDRGIPLNLGTLSAAFSLKSGSVGTIGDIPLSIGNQLGKGAFGEVFAAETIVRGKRKTIAVKVIADPTFASNIEMGYAARYNGRSFPEFYGYGVGPKGEKLLFMERLATPVVRVNQHGTVLGYNVTTEAVDKDFLDTLAQGVEVMHRNTDVHYDIKPQNLMLGEDGLPRILDFGTTRTYTQVTPEYISAVSSTYEYLAPELSNIDSLAQGKTIISRAYTTIRAGENFTIRSSEGKAYDPRAADIYSLGATFFELKTQRSFFEATMENSSNKEFLKIKPQGLGQLLQLMTDPNPFKRPTINEVRDWLRALYAQK
jgi:hypothetical protein